MKHLAIILAFMFFVLQSSTLVHSHDEDLNKHLDCTFCLKLGAGDDLLPSDGAIPPPIKAAFFLQYVEPAFVTIAGSRPRARSPPLSPII